MQRRRRLTVGGGGVTKLRRQRHPESTNVYV